MQFRPDGTGQNRMEPDRTGWNRMEPDRTGWNRTEPDGTGWNRTEPDRTGCNKNGGWDGSVRIPYPATGSCNYVIALTSRYPTDKAPECQSFHLSAILILIFLKSTIIRSAQTFIFQ